MIPLLSEAAFHGIDWWTRLLLRMEITAGYTGFNSRTVLSRVNDVCYLG